MPTGKEKRGKKSVKKGRAKKEEEVLTYWA